MTKAELDEQIAGLGLQDKVYLRSARGALEAHLKAGDQLVDMVAIADVRVCEIRSQVLGTADFW